MPGPAVHNIIGWQLADEFDRQADLLEGDADYTSAEVQGQRDAATLARRYPAHVALGTQGPDFLFFNSADWNGPFGSVAETYLDVVEWMDDMKADLREAFPIIEDAAELGDDLDHEMSENSNTYQELKRLMTTLGGVVEALVAKYKTAIEATVLDEVNVYSLLAHPYQICENTEEWWWFDALHYRKSGEFAAGLVQRADDLGGTDGDRLRAYAIGYLSHVAGDTIGHPYVNTVVRGPYRNHGQRHKVVENHQDAWAYAVYHGEEPDTFGEHGDVVQGVLDELREDQELDDEDLEDLTSSRLAFRQHLMTESSSEHFQTTRLPSYISEAFSGVAADLYGDDPNESFDTSRLGTDNVEDAYLHWYRWFEGATSSGTMEAELPDWEPPTEPTQSAWDDFVDAMEDLGEAFEDLWNGIENAFENGFSGDADFGGVLNFIEKLGEAVLSFATLALSAIDYILSLPIKALVEVLRYLLESVYQGLYNSWETYHQMIALLGFGYPLKHQIMRPETEHFVYPFRPDALGEAIGMENVQNEYSASTWPYPMQAVGKAGGPQYRFDEEDMDSLDSTGHLVFPYGGVDYDEFAEGNAYSVDAPVPGPSAYVDEWPAYYVDGRSYRDGPGAIDRYGDGFGAEPSAGDVGQPTRFPLDRDAIDDLGVVPGSGVGTDQKAVDRLAALQEPPATAVGLTAEYYRRTVAGELLPNVNLDGDRGFGYGEWMPAECPLPSNGPIMDFIDTPSLDDTVTPVPPNRGEWNPSDDEEGDE